MTSIIATPRSASSDNAGAMSALRPLWWMLLLGACGDDSARHIIDSPPVLGPQVAPGLSQPLDIVVVH